MRATYAVQHHTILQTAQHVECEVSVLLPCNHHTMCVVCFKTYLCQLGVHMIAAHWETFCAASIVTIC